VWVERLPAAPELEEPWRAAELAMRGWKERRAVVVPEE
jgi:hypothetical protein